jgi:hypothetical protein
VRRGTREKKEIKEMGKKEEEKLRIAKSEYEIRFLKPSRKAHINDTTTKS